MKGLTLAALVATATMGAAQDVKFGLGIQGGLFVPTDSALRDTFGASWFSFGISPSVLQEKQGFKIDWDLAITGRSRNGNRVTMIRPTLGGTLALGLGDIVPYVAGRAGIAYLDYGIERPGGRVSGRRLTPTTNFEVGILFSRRIGLSVRYDWISSQDGLNFSGFSLNATYQLYRF